MKPKRSTDTSDAEAIASARDFYSKLQEKEDAKRQGNRSPAKTTLHPPSSSSAGKTRNAKSTRIVTQSPPNSIGKCKSNKIEIDDTNAADLRARQYYKNLMKTQAVKDEMMYKPSPSKVYTPDSTGTKKSSQKKKKTTYTTVGSPALTNDKQSRLLDILCNDMFELEQKEAEVENRTAFDTNTGTSTSYVAKPSCFQSTSPKTKNTDEPIATSTNIHQSHRPSLRRIPISPIAAVGTNPANIKCKQDIASSRGWLGRLFTAVDVLIFLILYTVEMKFSILSSMVIMLIRLIMSFSWQMVVYAFENELLTIAVPTLVFCIGCCIVVARNYKHPATLLQSFRANCKIHNDQIQTDVVMILDMVYHELATQQKNVNVPIRTMQDMIFSQLFMDESFHATHMNVAKDRKYWIHTVWPRVVGQLLYRNPNVLVSRSIFSSDDSETYIRWKSSDTDKK